MNEVQAYRMQEDEAYGAFLIDTISAIYGITPGDKDAAKLIDKYAYKFTDCGAWVKFDSQGIVVGTIVEGSDAEYSERISLKDIDIDDAGEALLKKRYFAALQNCEDFSNEFGE